jgi:ribosomal protein S18 acetylase RimI-like enzyme
MLSDDRIECRELFDITDPAVGQTQHLYELTQSPAERIPWKWIERGLKRRQRWRTADGASLWHLVVAHRRADPEATPIGFAHGSTLPGFGGYVSYLGVDPATRGRGTGTRLFESLFALMRADAAALGEPLPFAIWESRAPTAKASEAVRANWLARLRLFQRVGALAVGNATFLTPDYRDASANPVPLQLFLKPLDTPASWFDSERLRQVIAELQRRIYGQSPGEPLYDATLAADVRPVLHSPAAWAELCQPRPAGRLPAECWR